MNIRADIQEFIKLIASGQLEIYNEFSLQHELGIFLRNIYPSHKVQFERNVSYFGLNKTDFEKREIDISIFTQDKNEFSTVIELKYPRIWASTRANVQFLQRYCLLGTTDII